MPVPKWILSATIVGVVVLALALRDRPPDSPRAGAGMGKAQSRPTLRVALQAGHWRNDDVPDELALLRTQHGTRIPGADEWQVNLAIARETRRLLERNGVAVDLFAARVPPRYRAQAFVSIHSDGTLDPDVSGFRVAGSRSDATGRARDLSLRIAEGYGARTRLRWNPNVTPDMTHYYAFNARRYRNSVSPRTPAAIVETGFLTNAADQRIIVNAPAVAAQGIADGIQAFLAGRS